MDPEVKRQLEEIHALTRDNHRMLRAIRRHQWYGMIATVIFWLVVFAAPFYIYQQYLQPLVTRFQVTSGAGATSASAEIGKLLNLFGAGR